MLRGYQKEDATTAMLDLQVKKQQFNANGSEAQAIQFADQRI